MRAPRPKQVTAHGGPSALLVANLETPAIEPCLRKMPHAAHVRAACLPPSGDRSLSVGRLLVGGVSFDCVKASISDQPLDR
jgi:hypothetical protein